MKIFRIILYAGFLMALIIIQYLIWHGESLITQQKLVSSLFSWIIPCIWFIVILCIVRTPDSDRVVKECLFYRFTFALN